ncbi:MAG: hypothetical protein ACPG31_07940 [Planctomycetota bacterium]
MLSLAPLLLSLLAIAQEPAAETPRFEGTHCSFPFSNTLTVREYGTGWGVVAEVGPARNPGGAYLPILRVYSVLSNTSPADLAMQILQAEEPELAARGMKFNGETADITRVVDGEERGGLSLGLVTGSDETPAGEILTYSWANEGSALVVRIYAPAEWQKAAVDQMLDGMVAPGIRSDSMRRVGSYDYGFQVPANWQTNEKDLGDGYFAFTIATPSGNIEMLHSPSIYGESRTSEWLKLRQSHETRFEQMEAQGHGKRLGERRAWLNIEGSLVEGSILRWQGADGQVMEIPSFLYLPEECYRVVQLQLLPQVGKEAELLASTTRMTRLDTYRNQVVTLNPEILGLDGMRLSISRGLSGLDSVGDTFQGGHGVAFGAKDDGGPRWFFWSLPLETKAEELEALQAKWMQDWIDRDFQGATVESRQFMTTEMDGRDSLKGAAWTIAHTPTILNEEDEVVPGEMRKWMIAMVAVPLGERTLLAAVRVDVRDRNPMLDEIRHAVRNVQAEKDVYLATPEFKMALPKDGPFASIHRTTKASEEFHVLHKDGRVLILAEFFEQEIADSIGPTTGSFGMIRDMQAALRGSGVPVANAFGNTWTRIGNRDQPWNRFNYVDAQHSTHTVGATGWKIGNVRLTWFVDGRGHAFQKDLALLQPEGEALIDLDATTMSYAGLRLPTGGRFGWRGSPDHSIQFLHLTFDGLRQVEVGLGRVVDANPDQSDLELLKTLMPEEPEWDPVTVVHRMEITREVFGKTSPGWRIQGRTPHGVPVRMEIVMDRRDGMVRYLLMQGPDSLYVEAGPLLDDVLAAIKPEKDVQMWKPATPRPDSVVRKLGPFKLALPGDFHRAEQPDGEGWHWTDPLESAAVLLMPLDPSEKVAEIIHSSVMNARANPQSTLYENITIPAYSNLVQVDGRALPGFHGAMGGIDAAAVMLSHNETNYLLVTFDGIGKGPIALLQEAISTIDLDSEEASGD